MGQISTKYSKQVASRLMLASKYDPQTGNGEAFTYLFNKVSAVDNETDLCALSEEMASHLSENCTMGLSGEIQPAKLLEVLERSFN